MTEEIKIKGESREFEIIEELTTKKGTYAVAFKGNKGIFGYVTPTKEKGVYEWEGYEK